MESLREYIRQMMRIKNLKGVDIQERSGGKITDAYIFDILNGKTKRIGVEKIQAIADGLGVDSIEVFKVAVGYKEESVSNHWPGPILIKAMEKIVHSPELTRIVKKLLTFKPSKLKALLKQLEKE
ncbi:MAG: helix-turn-helix transcriptional regulator [Blastocatellia bacterium]